MPSVMIANRRLRLAGHIARHEDLLANKLLFWDPQHGHRGRGRPHLTYIDVLRKDTCLSSVEEIRTVMLERDVWRGVVADRTKKPTWVSQWVRIEVCRARDDADTMVANKALNISLVIVSNVDVKAEDTDMLCLLVHHFNPERHNNIIIATKWGTFSIHEIVNQWDEKAILLHTVFRVVILLAVCMDMAKRRC